jgi:hypothetical protein
VLVTVQQMCQTTVLVLKMQSDHPWLVPQWLAKSLVH